MDRQLDRQFLVEIKDDATDVYHKVWVISPNPDNMQKFIEEHADRLPYQIHYPKVVSVKEMPYRTIRLQLIDKIFPVLK